MLNSSSDKLEPRTTAPDASVSRIGTNLPLVFKIFVFFPGTARYCAASPKRSEVGGQVFALTALAPMPCCGELRNTLLGCLTCAWDDDHVCHVIGMFIGCHSPSLTGNRFDLLIAIDINPISNLVRQRNSFTDHALQIRRIK
jgi:hypothetical protein